MEMYANVLSTSRLISVPTDVPSNTEINVRRDSFKLNYSFEVLLDLMERIFMMCQEAKD